MKKLSQQLIIPILIAAIWCAWPDLSIAQSMQSTNYKIPSDDLSGGGGASNSTNYALTDTVSEFTSPSGEDLTSTNYRACVGFECTGTSAFITASLATSSSPCTSTTSGSGPFSVPLGTLTTGAVTTGTNHVCLIASAAGETSVAVTVKGAGTGLKSATVPAATIGSVNTTLVAGTAGYGICSTNAANGFSASSPFNGSCNTSTNHAVGGPTTTPQTIYTATGTITNAFGDVLVKAAISGTTAAHTDYVDTLTFVTTATF